MDVSTITGVVVAFGSIIEGYLLEYGVLSSLFLFFPSLIVFGGTWGVIILSSGPRGTLAVLKFLVGMVFTKHSLSPERLIRKMREMADACHKEGLLKLQTILDDSGISDDSFLSLKEEMILTLDTKPTEEITSTMTTNLDACAVKKNMEVEVFTTAGGSPPTPGIIGTVMGLIQMLSSMMDAAVLMASIAVVFLATLYGTLLANLLYFPMANRIKVDLKRQKIYHGMMIKGMCLIASGKSTRDAKNQLSLYYHVFKNGQKKYKEGINS